MNFKEQIETRESGNEWEFCVSRKNDGVNLKEREEESEWSIREDGNTKREQIKRGHGGRKGEAEEEKAEKATIMKELERKMR